jgi:cytochrome c oxidase subunit I+III
MAVTLVANGALYLSLLFGWFYLGIVTPGASPAPVGIGAGWLLGSALLLTAGTLYLGLLLRHVRRGGTARLAGHLSVLTLLALLQVALLIGALGTELQPRARALDAVALVMLLYSLIHCALAAILTALQAWRALLGYVSARQPYEPGVVAQLWLYNLAVLWISYAAIVLFPLGWGGGS